MVKFNMYVYLFFTKIQGKFPFLKNYIIWCLVLFIYLLAISDFCMPIKRAAIAQSV